ncbi:hypothetical protein [Bartonella grahamii]|uniref:hypothetical protein n=1 Tax=Bartonella grahamii TaxID=33045 RepID=UPI002E7AEB11|nr:hypothetical protein [Bartonella grahamii]
MNASLDHQRENMELNKTMVKVKTIKLLIMQIVDSSLINDPRQIVPELEKAL